MTRRQTWIGFVLLIIALLNLFGCENKEQKAAKKIVEALEQKYGEEFVLDSIGGGYGTMNSNTFKAMVHPKKYKTIRIAVEITKDLEKVYDDGQPIILRSMTETSKSFLTEQVEKT